MNTTLDILVLLTASLLSLITTTLTYALRDLSRVRLADELGKRGQDKWFEPTLQYSIDLSFICGTLRLVFNILILLALVDWCRIIRGGDEPDWLEYLVALIGTTFITMIVSLALPRAIANQSGEAVIAMCIRPLHQLRRIFMPLTTLMHAAERLVVRAAPDRSTPLQQESLAEEEILDAITEGEISGVVDDRQRKLIESVMEFRSATVDDVMTLRQQIVAMPATATLAETLNKFEQTGHSRIPIYAESIDKIVGVLYARDMLKQLGKVDNATFDLKGMLRTPLYVPRTKLLRDLLQDFRLQKVHIAIVLDEYGGTTGLITIEDVIEQLVGDISDEHEPLGPTLFKRIDDNTAECDAGIEIEDFNRLLGVDLPDDEDYDTVGGFVTKELQRIPATGVIFESHGVRFTVIEAAPAKVVRVRVEVLPKVAG